MGRRSAGGRVVEGTRRDQPQVRIPERPDAITRVRLCMPARACLRLCLLIAAATASGLSVPASADPRRGLVVIVPPPREPAPPPPASQAQPPKLWLPPAAMGLLPGAPSPAPRCYAGTNVCPLVRSEQVGQACTCTTPGDTISGDPTTGRALIPPSCDVAGHSCGPSSDAGNMRRHGSAA